MYLMHKTSLDQYSSKNLFYLLSHSLVSILKIISILIKFAPNIIVYILFDFKANPLKFG
jgi:hypothetical protein